MNSLKKKFAKYLDDKRISLSKAERMSGLSNGLLGKLFATDKEFTKETLECILKAFPDFSRESNGRHYKDGTAIEPPSIDEAIRESQIIDYMKQSLLYFEKAMNMIGDQVKASNSNTNRITGVLEQQMNIINRLTGGSHSQSKAG